MTVERKSELDALLDERAIRRVLLEYCRGIDRVDLDLVRSCYWPEATDNHGTFVGPRDAFIDWVGPLLRRQTMTMHVLGNIVVDTGLGGRPDAAACETYAVAYHSGEPAGDIRWNNATGFRYLDRFERRGGVWRIAARTVALEWVRAFDADRERAARLGERLARRDRADPVYALFGLEGPGRAAPGD